MTDLSEMRRHAEKCQRNTADVVLPPPTVLALLDVVPCLAALLDHAERIQEHVPKSEEWYAVRDNSRAALSRLESL